MAWSLLDSGTTTFANGAGGHSYSYPGGAPASGDLLILGINSDTTVSTPSGWTPAVSSIAAMGAYAFYRVAGAGEASSVTITTSVNANTALSFVRYSGQATSSPLDVTASAVTAGGGSSSPGVDPAALAGSGELALLWAMCKDPASATAGTSPVPPSGYANLLDTGLSGGTGGGQQHFLVGRTDASGDPPSLSVSWSSVTFQHRVGLFVAFLPTSTITGAAAMSGSGSLTAAGEIIHTGAATLSGAGTLTASPEVAATPGSMVTGVARTGSMALSVAGGG